MDVLKDIAAAKETLWINPNLKSVNEAAFPVSDDQIKDASKRLERFRPFLAKTFSDCPDGIIESPLKEISGMKTAMNKAGADISGRLFLKMDSLLAIAGSVKARGGVYEVLKHAETLALNEGVLKETDDYSLLCDLKDFFGKYTIQVGSTGNLGLSIGITAAALGFKVIVHMSADARQWKKDMLRSKGVTVVEYDDDYSKAVEEGRRNSDADPMSYFVDDENSVDLFLGYAVAAERLAKQLEEQNVEVNEKHPLIVYIPCGVGGAPGGVAYGLKRRFGDNVHCFFVEPVQCPCMLVGMATGKHNEVCVQDFGLSGITEADGLAVGRPSGFVGKTMGNLLSGVFTVEDNRLFDWLRMLDVEENVRIELSACAAFAGSADRMKYEDGKKYFENLPLENCIEVCWATGGSLVPEDIMKQYLAAYMEG